MRCEHYSRKHAFTTHQVVGGFSTRCVSTDYQARTTARKATVLRGFAKLKKFQKKFGSGWVQGSFG